MTEKVDMVRLGMTNPHVVSSLTLRDWDVLIRQARSSAVLGRLHAVLEEAQIIDHVPMPPRNHLEAARVVAGSQERVIRWEVYCIRRALARVETEFVLLKGAAYVLSGLPFARGRIQSDVDILAAKSKLRTIEAALLEQGWIHMKLDKYDQRFYREWSHELPPLYHPHRGTVLDVHHNILPSTGRVHPDPQKLLRASEDIPGTPYKRLCPPDMVLHACAHMFQDGDFEQGFRELTDIDGLLRAFSGTTAFWDQLSQRAQEMQLYRPLFYGLRYAYEFLNTPIPQRIISASLEWAPSGPVLHAMDALVRQALVPRMAATLNTRYARWVLYMRSHWLRMPPLLLARHLLHQSLRRR